MKNKMIYVIVGIVVVALIALFFWKKNESNNSDEYFISTQGQSNERVKGLSLDKPSEDASHILNIDKLSFPKNKWEDEENEEKDYRAEPELNWIVKIIPEGGDVFKKDDLWNLFNQDWRSNFNGATVYGHTPEDGLWTYVIAGGTPDTYDSVEVAISLQGVFNSTDNPEYEPKNLTRYLDELEQRFSKFPLKVKLEVSEEPEMAIEKAKKIVELYNRFDQDMIVVLKADGAFNGIEAWDALSSVGLKWGDGDLFHWNNYEFDFGHDQFFSVWTTTNPGFFFPEEVKAGRFNPEDLVFGYSIPRCADPENMLGIVHDAVSYCQKRLGGQILNSNGIPFNKEEEMQKLSETVEEMKKEGIIPGSSRALISF